MEKKKTDMQRMQVVKSLFFTMRCSRLHQPVMTFKIEDWPLLNSLKIHN